MSKKVDVSVIMAEYNTDVELLKESIQSILNQTFTNFELIIIDDCGKNNVNEIVESFHDPRIKVYKNEKNSGLIYSLNKAIEKAEGQYLVRMDTDDYAYPNRIESQYQFIKNTLNIPLWECNVNFMMDNRYMEYLKKREK